MVALAVVLSVRYISASQEIGGVYVYHTGAVLVLRYDFQSCPLPGAKTADVMSKAADEAKSGALWYNDPIYYGPDSGVARAFAAACSKS
jgi:hypothetical protein